MSTASEFAALFVRCRGSRTRMVNWLDAEAEWCKLMASTGNKAPMPDGWPRSFSTMSAQQIEQVADALRAGADADAFETLLLTVPE